MAIHRITSRSNTANGAICNTPRDVGIIGGDARFQARSRPGVFLSLRLAQPDLQSRRGRDRGLPALRQGRELPEQIPANLVHVLFSADFPGGGEAADL